MALRLGPGGKGLMVILGIAVIVLGLYAYGYLDGLVGLFADGSVPPEEAGGPAAPKRSDAAADRPVASPAVQPAPTPAAGAPPVPGVAADPPPLLGLAPDPLRLFDGVGGAAAALSALTDGEADLAVLPLHEALSAGAGPGLTVVGALEPDGRAMLCADEDPLSGLAQGARVIAGPADRLRVAHLAALRGVAPESLRWVSGPPADLEVTGTATEGRACVGLASLGLGSPRVVLAPAASVRLWGASYRRRVRALGAAEPAARALLLAPPKAPLSYLRRATWLSGLAAALEGRDPVPPPAVAGWILSEETP